jgi:outer membrane receptor protein involved in Fe transport
MKNADVLRILRASSVVFSLILCVAWGQTSRGTITGIVTDPSGAVVANASVEITNETTNVVRSTTTNDSGFYRFDAVDLGSYSVGVKHTGFRTFVKRSVPILSGLTASVDVQLEVGDTQTTVEVVANAVLLQQESVVRGGNISVEAATQLPFASRNPVSLALTLPGVSSNRYGFGQSTFVVNGSRGRSNNFMIDGVENNDTGVSGQSHQIQNPEAVEEVSVQTSNYDAEYGRAGGAVVNTITKPGTNEFHGAGFFVLDSTFDDAITNTQSLSPDVMKRGRPLFGIEKWYGGRIGGPVVRNRTFFSFAYHEQRQRSNSTSNVTAPTAAGLANLNRLFPQGANPRADLYRQVIGSTVGSANPFNADLGGGRGNIEFGTAVFPFSQREVERQFVMRGDHNFSERDLLSMRYVREASTSPQGAIANFFPGFSTSVDGATNNAVISETHIFSPSLTNELRVAYSRLEAVFPLNTENPLGQTLPRYSLGGGVFSIGVQTNLPQGRFANNYVLQDTISWVRGSHTFRFGLDVNQQRGKDLAPVRDRGEISYGAATGYSIFGNFLDDFGGSSGGAFRDFGSPANFPRVTRQAYFFQDRWRFNQALTLTLGVRYDYYGQPINSLTYAAFSGLFNVDPSTLDGPYRHPSRVKDDKNNWSPTVGIAYSPSFQNGLLGTLLGDRRTVFRTGYQISYDLFFNNILSNAATSTPNVIATSTPSQVTSELPRGLPNLSQSLPRVAREALPSDTQTLVASDLVAPYTQRWSFGIQREIARQWIADVSYVGSRGVRLLINEDLNPSVPTGLRRAYTNVRPGFVLQPRLDPLQGGRLTRTNGGNSIYHALQSEVNRRFANGMGLRGSYTWSKLIDNSSEVFGVAATGSPQQSAIPSIFGGLRNERALSLFDRTHRFVFSYVYQLPFREDQQGFAGRLLGGWQLSGITTLETGVPLTITNGVDADGLGGALDRPDFNPNGRKNVRAVPLATSPTGYINPDTANREPINPADAMYITLPAHTGAQPLRTGTLGRNTERSPGITNFDVNLQKRIRLTERFNLELRTEFYNIFNHPQFGSPSISPFSPGQQGFFTNATTAPNGQFLLPNIADGGGRVLRYQVRFSF